MIGRIDVHSHLLPGIDDGCPTIADSLTCARALVDAGYTHSFCTPHIWPNMPKNTIPNITEWTRRLQIELDEAKIPLRLFPGGENSMRKDFSQIDPQALITYGMNRKYLLFDLWTDEMPDYFADAIRWIQDQGLTVILAHPERMRLVWDHPEAIDQFQDMGLLLQGNLYCLLDPPDSHSCQAAVRCLTEGRYFMLGSDLHRAETTQVRLAGLKRAIELVGDEKVWELTRDNPLKLFPEPPE